MGLFDQQTPTCSVDHHRSSTLNTGVPQGCVLGLFLSQLFTQECRPVRTLNLCRCPSDTASPAACCPGLNLAYLGVHWVCCCTVRFVLITSSQLGIAALLPGRSVVNTNLLVQATVIYHNDSGNAPFYSNWCLWHVASDGSYGASLLVFHQSKWAHITPLLSEFYCHIQTSSLMLSPQRICSFLLEQSCWSVALLPL